MSIDRRGNKLHVGDIVYVPCKVTGIDEQKEGLNVSLEPLEPLVENHDGSHPLMLMNSRQVELVYPVGESVLDVPVATAISDSALARRDKK